MKKERKVKVRICRCKHVELYHRRKVRCEFPKCKCKKFDKKKTKIVILTS